VAVRYEHSLSLPALRDQLHLSVLLSTYQASRVVSLGSHQGQLQVGFSRFDQAMGLKRTPTGKATQDNGWRDNKATGGCLIHGPTGHVVLRGLAMPHSPRLYQGQVLLLDSGHGALIRFDPLSGQHNTIATGGSQHGGAGGSLLVPLRREGGVRSHAAGGEVISAFQQFLARIDELDGELQARPPCGLSRERSSGSVCLQPTRFSGPAALSSWAGPRAAGRTKGVHMGCRLIHTMPCCMRGEVRST